MPVKININKAAVRRHAKEAWEKALPTLSEEVLKDCNEFAPQDNGALIASSQQNSVPETGTLVWNTPYAQYLWYGILMVAPNGSAWAKKGEKKHTTGKPLHFSKDQNPKATKMWTLAAKRKYKEKWRKQAEKLMEENL